MTGRRKGSYTFQSVEAYACPEYDYFSSGPGTCPKHKFSLQSVLVQPKESETTYLFFCLAPYCDYVLDRPGICPVHATTLHAQPRSY